MTTIYYHYFRLMLHRTDNSQTECATVSVTSKNETVAADDIRILFKTVLYNIGKTVNVKFGRLEYIRTEVSESCQ